MCSYAADYELHRIVLAGRIAGLRIVIEVGVIWNCPGSAENLMIARPYGLALFRRGPPAGPHYLLQVLRGTMTRQEAVRQWDAAEGAEDRNQMIEAKWPFSMRLPCRLCSDPNNESPFKPMQAYVPSKQPHR